MAAMTRGGGYVEPPKGAMVKGSATGNGECVRSGGLKAATVPVEGRDDSF